jgi:hypothetical protein
MAFNRLYKHIETLVRNDEEEVADNIPCKADILSIRECRKDGKVRYNIIYRVFFVCLSFLHFIIIIMGRFFFS